MTEEGSDLPLVDKSAIETTNNVTYPEPNKLNSDLFGLENPKLHLLEQKGAEGKSNILGVYLTEEKNGDIVHVGHVIFSVDQQEYSATLSINHTKTRSFQNGLISAPEIPEEVKGLTKEGDILNALEINDKHKGKGRGGYLFLAALKVLQQKGIKRLEIVGDTTIGQKEGHLSTFYEYYGAKVDESGTMFFEDIDQTISTRQQMINDIFNHQEEV